MMSTVTREQVLERVAGLGHIQNVFLIAEDNASLGLPIIWYPEIGLRYAIIENDDLAQAVYEYLRYEARVRRFKSEREVSEAMYKEKWEGWDTCDDYRRTQQGIRSWAEGDTRAVIHQHGKAGIVGSDSTPNKLNAVSEKPESKKV